MWCCWIMIHHFYHAFYLPRIPRWILAGKHSAGNVCFKWEYLMCFNMSHRQSCCTYTMAHLFPALGHCHCGILAQQDDELQDKVQAGQGAAAALPAGTRTQISLPGDRLWAGYLVRDRFCQQSASGWVKAGLELERDVDPVVTKTAAEDAEMDM